MPVPAQLSVPRDLGKILACRHVASHSREQVANNPIFQRHRWTAETGHEQFIIQYVSQGPVGKPRRVTALLYLPTGGKGPHPIVAVNHGTNGLGPRCGPTHVSSVVDYMAVPLAGRGYAVVATDYMGMGVDEGVWSYGVGEAEGLNILDGVRALRSFRDPRFDHTRLDDTLFLLGHSQGGQATLFAHQLYDPSVGKKLLGSVTFAPGMGDLRGLDVLLGQPARPMDGATIFATLILHSLASYHGSPDPKAVFRDGAYAQLTSLLHDQCWLDLAQSIPARWPRTGDLFTPTFQRAAATCNFSGTPCPGFQPWSDRLRANVPGAFKSDVPALLLQGDRDDIVLPYMTACVLRRLSQSGTAATACGYPASNHFTIVDDAFGDTIAWMEARRQGKTRNPCKSALTATCPP